MNDFPWVWALITVIATAGFIALVRLGPDLIHGGRLPARIGGIQVELEAARLADDRVTERVWSVPVIFTNRWRKPVPVPDMYNRTTVWTRQRAQGSPFRFQYRGQLEFERCPTSSDGSRLVLNPGEHILGFVTVTLPEDRTPALLRAHRWNGSSPYGAFRGRVHVPTELAPSQPVAPHRKTQ